MANVTYEDIDNLGENYYEVTVYKHGEEDPVDGFCCYGDVWGIADMMDSLWLLDAVPHEGWDSYHACLTFPMPKGRGFLLLRGCTCVQVQNPLHRRFFPCAPR